jgi:hypothetical protein
VLSTGGGEALPVQGVNDVGVALATLVSGLTMSTATGPPSSS